MNITKFFRDFTRHENSAGILLIAITLVTLLATNLFLPETLPGFWKNNLLGKPIDFWVNDLLMTFFFLLVGLEIEREIYVGELSSLKQALLPILAAAGGMLVPAFIYVAFNYNSGNLGGFGIPMATDIAFSLTILTILSSRVPSSMKVFLTALAIIDDLGAILIIALFYTKGFSFLYLGLALALLALMVIINRKGVQKLIFYFVPGALMWICIYKAGIHPTITGVVLAFVIPFGKGEETSPSHRLESLLHKPVAFVVLPVFAMANTAIVLNASDFGNLLAPASIGIILGLVLGKPLGIFLFSLAGVKLKICAMFENLEWKHIIGAGMVAGIGFTMSIFITLLAFQEPDSIKAAKIAVLIASFVSAIAGFLFIRTTGTVSED